MTSLCINSTITILAIILCAQLLGKLFIKDAREEPTDKT